MKKQNRDVTAALKAALDSMALEPHLDPFPYTFPKTRPGSLKDYFETSAKGSFVPGLALRRMAPALIKFLVKIESAGAYL
jgi:hypothetical protein